MRGYNKPQQQQNHGYQFQQRAAPSNQPQPQPQPAVGGGSGQYNSGQYYYAQHNPVHNQETHSVILVTAGYDHTIRFWEALSGICSRTIQHPDSQVNKLAISPDRRYLAAAGNPHVRLYDINSNNPNPVASFDGHTSNITAVSFHSEGKWMVTGSEDGTVKIWDLRSATVQRNFDHKAPVNDVIIHPNQGELISCDQSGSIRIWDLAKNCCSFELVPEDDVPMRSLTAGSDGTLLIAGNNKGTVFVWRMSGGKDATQLQPIKSFSAHTRYLTKCLLSPDVKHLATCSADTTVKIWDARDNSFELERTLMGHQRWVWDCSFSADSAYLVTASSDHTARLLDLSQGELIRQYNGHNKAAVCVALNDQSRFE
ncbi:uncharacterized protein VTP21DRAFT_2341 [Calcarisporiella thermophila]|uniref:uncharacterized protein n=1 Tax=Calcarisporiella thermophila TaxID=911321 RepID=UPI0037444A66